MRGPWRPLTCAAAITMTVAAGVATAQTVTVIKAPSGATVELVLNTATIGSTTATPAGLAILDVNLSARRGKDEIDTTIFVDACGLLRRIHFVEPGVQGLPAPGDCLRREIPGVYVVRNVTSFVIDVSDPMPSVRFRQGRAPDAWLNPEAEESGEGSSREWGPMPTGVIAFGGAGLAMSNNQLGVACGNVTDCSGSGNRLALNLGLDVWFTSFLGVEGSYLRPTDVTVEGKGDGHRFTNSLDIHLATAGGKVGIPAGPARFYAKGGITYSRVESLTTQTTYTVTGEGEYPTIDGGYQSFGLSNTGWGWFAGGGAEIWFSKRLAFYGEYLHTPVGGASSVGGEGVIDETATSFLGGIRFKVGG